MQIPIRILGMPFWILAPIIAICATFWMELACLLLRDFLKKPVTLYALNTLVEIVLVIKEDKTRPTKYI